MKIRAVLGSLIVAVGLLASACPNRVNIGKINANPSKYQDKDVVIAGRVSNSFGIPLVGGIYKLDDGTGSIWVVTSKGVPSKGAEVGLKGRVQEGVNYSGKSYGLGVIEKERKVR